MDCVELDSCEPIPALKRELRFPISVLLTRWLREPLAHFLMIGMGLFVVYRALNPGANQVGSARRIEVTGRAHPKARLYSPPPARRAGRGRPRVRGERLPSPQELLEGRAQHREFEVAPGRRYRVRVASIKGCFFQVPNRLVHLVALEHIGQRREDEVFYTTCTEAAAEQVVRWYARRWSIEVTFRDAKQHLAVGREQNRTPAAARRTAAMGFLIYSLVVLWHEFARPEPVTGVRDYPGKRHASFADMLAALRRDSLAQQRPKHFEASPQLTELQKNYQYLEKLLILAA